MSPWETQASQVCISEGQHQNFKSRISTEGSRLLHRLFTCTHKSHCTRCMSLTWGVLRRGLTNLVGTLLWMSITIETTDLGASRVSPHLSCRATKQIQICKSQNPASAKALMSSRRTSSSLLASVIPNSAVRIGSLAKAMQFWQAALSEDRRKLRVTEGMESHLLKSTLWSDNAQQRNDVE